MMTVSGMCFILDDTDHTLSHLKNVMYYYHCFTDVKIEAVSNIIKDILAGGLRARTETEVPGLLD